MLFYHTWYVLEKQKQKDINKEKDDDPSLQKIFWSF